MSQYFALNEKDIEFDNNIRDTVKKSRSKSHMALYLQGQEELNLLRELVQRQRDMAFDLAIINNVVNHYHELVERDNQKISVDEAYLQILDELAGIKYSINGLLEYICEDDDDKMDSLSSSEKELVNDAIALVRINAAKANKEYCRSNSESDGRLVDLWDYILCSMEFIKSLY